MLLLTSTSDKIQVVTGAAVNVDVHASFLDLASGAVAAGRTNSKITTATTTDVVASPAASTTRNVKALHIANVHATLPVQVTIQHTDGTNVVQLESVNLQASERISYREGVGMRVIDANGIPKDNTPVAQGSYFVQTLGADVSNSTVTAAKISGLDFVCAAGTWIFEYFIRYQGAAATTGVKFSVNHTGTVTAFMADFYGVSAETTVATQAALMSQNVVGGTTGGLMEAWSARAKSTAAGVVVTSGTDTLASDMLMMISGIVIVTVSGNMELYHASEVAAASTVKIGSALRLTKVA